MSKDWTENSCTVWEHLTISYFTAVGTGTHRNKVFSITITSTAMSALRLCFICIEETGLRRQNNLNQRPSWGGKVYILGISWVSMIAFPSLSLVYISRQMTLTLLKGLYISATVSFQFSLLPLFSLYFLKRHQKQSPPPLFFFSHSPHLSLLICDSHQCLYPHNRCLSHNKVVEERSAPPLLCDRPLCYLQPFRAAGAWEGSQRQRGYCFHMLCPFTVQINDNISINGPFGEAVI